MQDSKDPLEGNGFLVACALCNVEKVSPSGECSSTASTSHTAEAIAARSNLTPAQAALLRVHLVDEHATFVAEAFLHPKPDNEVSRNKANL